MHRYVLMRLFQTVPTLIGVTLISFVAMYLIGDPAHLVLGEHATEEAIQEYRRETGLDRPVHEQYFAFLGDAVTGDFGDSLRYHIPVTTLIMERLPATMALGLSALAIAIVFGCGMGVLSALRYGRPGDETLRGIALVGQAIPGFYLGLILVIVFSLKLGWLPTGGIGGPQHLVLPSITLASYLIALLFRFTRSSLLEVLNQDYMRTARAKGLNESAAIRRHAFKNAMIPVITVIGLQSGVVFGGAVVTETIFSWPGLGRLMVEAIQARDYPILRAGLLFIAVAVIAVNLVVDLTYGLVDPRVKYR
jgi:peptide/nickel transport system permease protein